MKLLSIITSLLQADKHAEEAARMQQHSLRLLDKGAIDNSAVNGHLRSASPAPEHLTLTQDMHCASENSIGKGAHTLLMRLYKVSW